MGKVYKDKQSKGCALCKPHKHGWAPKKKAKVIAVEKDMDKEITGATGISSKTQNILREGLNINKYRIVGKAVKKEKMY